MRIWILECGGLKMVCGVVNGSVGFMVKWLNFKLLLRVIVLGGII